MTATPLTSSWFLAKLTFPVAGWTTAPLAFTWTAMFWAEAGRVVKAKANTANEARRRRGAGG